jgi:hypothetical protein
MTWIFFIEGPRSRWTDAPQPRGWLCKSVPVPLCPPQTPHRPTQASATNHLSHGTWPELSNGCEYEDTMHCSLVQINRRLGGMSRLHHRDRQVKSHETHVNSYQTTPALDIYQHIKKCTNIVFIMSCYPIKILHVCNFVTGISCCSLANSVNTSAAESVRRDWIREHSIKFPFYYINNSSISLTKRPFVVTHTIRQTEISALLD